MTRAMCLRLRLGGGVKDDKNNIQLCWKSRLRQMGVR